MTNSPTLVEIRHAATKLQGQILQTPVVPLTVNSFKKVLPANSAVMIKLELLQHAGSFKARGDWLGIDALSELQRASGVVAASGGNHALAVSWAAQAVGVSATILMPASADKVRIAGCKSNGATVLLFDDISTAFAEMERLAADENLAMMHPFEAPHMTLGAATCGAEYIDECPDTDVFVVPVGGGGMISGMAAAIKQINPRAQVFGVEPYGADSMFRSFAAGVPVRLQQINTIADTLGSPCALPYSFSVAGEYVEGIVRIHDHEMLGAMQLMFNGLKLVAEPACSATLAAICGPLREQCEG